MARHWIAVEHKSNSGSEREDIRRHRRKFVCRDGDDFDSALREPLDETDGQEWGIGDDEIDVER